MTVRVPAKVNLQLAVGPVRPDGFHRLANVFLAVGLYDEVTAAPSDGLGVTVTGPGADRRPLHSGSIAARAATLLARHHGRAPTARLHIAKGIPVAGGMAGGSADAAGALLACATLWQTGSTRAELRELSRQLGSDVPFALVGGAALGRGRGDLVNPLQVGGAFHWAFALADGALVPPAVYRECDRLRARWSEDTGRRVPEPEPRDAVLAALRAGDAPALGAALMADGTSNDLQPAALSLMPALARTLRVGTEAGALAAIVSGSGPTCAFLADSAGAAQEVARALRESGTCRATRLARGPVTGAVVV
ncbi:4-(cytidine 5'-diphospho)-2-C-methyl-D-erythritol kinase [Streptomyces sp. 796.1]|uniref:4-(cytidine 5'-diphospho)-2-C-methyl-D-erythritol kinase n=1 Tax=Streptomyces sp. 796.1 TaxID=3163029 RepID=UPI0039C8C2BE